MLTTPQPGMDNLALPTRTSTQSDVGALDVPDVTATITKTVTSTVSSFTATETAVVTVTRTEVVTVAKPPQDIQTETITASMFYRRARSAVDSPNPTSELPAGPPPLAPAFTAEHQAFRGALDVRGGEKRTDATITTTVTVTTTILTQTTVPSTIATIVFSTKFAAPNAKTTVTVTSTVFAHHRQET